MPTKPSKDRPNEAKLRLAVLWVSLALAILQVLEHVPKVVEAWRWLVG